MLESIIVQCERADLRTHTAKVTIHTDPEGAVQTAVFEFGTAPMDAAWLVDSLVGYGVEETPEIADLYGPAGWNARELAAWVTAFEMEADGEHGV